MLHKLIDHSIAKTSRDRELNILKIVSLNGFIKLWIKQLREMNCYVLGGWQNSSFNI